jgi:hypothetical protein
MSSVRPVCLHRPEVLGILAGRKTQLLRPLAPEWRIPKLDPDWDGQSPNMKYQAIGQNHSRWGFSVFGETERQCAEQQAGRGPQGRRWNLLWVRETWACLQLIKNETGYVEGFRELYKTDVRDGEWRLEYGATSAFNFPNVGMRGFRWRSAACMPRWASRLTLEVQDSRVQRLQELSLEDLKAADEPNLQASWDERYGPGSYEKNPWVWITTFEKTDRTEPLG